MTGPSFSRFRTPRRPCSTPRALLPFLKETSMLYLPPCLGSLSALAARENPRYAVTCLRVFEYAEDRCRIEATDGRRLLIVRGQGATDAPFGQPLDEPAHEG